MKLSDFGSAQRVSAPLFGSTIDNPRWKAPEIFGFQTYDQVHHLPPRSSPCLPCSPHVSHVA